MLLGHTELAVDEAPCVLRRTSDTFAPIGHIDLNLTFVALSKELGLIEGQVAALFVMVVAAAEVTVGLAIIVSIFRLRASAHVDELAELKG